MNNHSEITHWATDYLSAKGYSLDKPPEVVQETPWSTVICFSTLQGHVYLKQPALLLAKEHDVIEHLAQQFQASVPSIIANNADLHCFLMEDAGLSLRNYITEENKSDLLCQAIKKFTAFQRSTENNIDLLLNLNIPNWRLEQLPGLYEKIVKDKEFLKANGLEDKELDKLNYLTPIVIEQTQTLSHYGIYETMVQPDFNTNNMLINPKTQQLTIIDLGELAISHPFFSLHNFLYQATLYHEVREHSQLWQMMLDACIENWLDLWPKDKLLEGYKVSKLVWPIYCICANYHLMHSVDSQALNSWDRNKPNRIARVFRQYMAHNA